MCVCVCVCVFGRQDSKGRTPLSVAREEGAAEAVALLQAAEAKAAAPVASNQHPTEASVAAGLE